MDTFQLFKPLTGGVICQKFLFSSLITIMISLCIPSNAQNKKAYLLPPMIIENPDSTADYAAVTRKFTGIPSLAVAGNGRLWAVWYTGPTPGEDRNNYVVVSTSGDQGQEHCFPYDQFEI